MRQYQHALEALAKLQPDLAKIRQQIHANPELGFNEVKTSTLVHKYLASLGIEVHAGIAGTGLVGVLRGKQSDSGKMIGLRADMDALPILEQTGLTYQSQSEGCMHACGHDGHTTMLLGAAKYLAQYNDFNGTVVFIFQPAEEGQGGAERMLAEGLFERFNCDAVYAMHCWPGLPAGTIGVLPGPMMAAADSFELTIHGKGGHGAHAYAAIDPVLVAAHCITALQSIVSRNVHPAHAAVLTVSAIQAGNLDADNVIPSTARMVGTVRTFNTDVREQIKQRMEKIVNNVCEGFDARAEFVYHQGFPPTINHPDHADLVASVGRELLGADKVDTTLLPSMGAEDFSYMLQQKPGAYFRIGQADAEHTYMLHNDRFNFNDQVIPVGSAMFASIVMKSMPLTSEE